MIDVKKITQLPLIDHFTELSYIPVVVDGATYKIKPSVIVANGIAGTSGTSGADGATGTSGTSGADGTSGTSGSSGPGQGITDFEVISGSPEFIKSNEVRFTSSGDGIKSIQTYNAGETMVVMTIKTPDTIATGGSFSAGLANTDGVWMHYLDYVVIDGSIAGAFYATVDGSPVFVCSINGIANFGDSFSIQVDRETVKYYHNGDFLGTHQVALNLYKLKCIAGSVIEPFNLSTIDLYATGLSGPAGSSGTSGEAGTSGTSGTSSIDPTARQVFNNQILDEAGGDYNLTPPSTGGIYVFTDTVGTANPGVFIQPANQFAIVTITNNTPYEISTDCQNGYGFVIDPILVGDTANFVWIESTWWRIYPEKNNCQQIDLSNPAAGTYYMNVSGVYHITDSSLISANLLTVPNAVSTGGHGTRYTIINSSDYPLYLVSASQITFLGGSSAIAYIDPHSMIEIVNAGGKWKGGYLIRNNNLPIALPTLAAVVDVGAVTTTTADFSGNVLSDGGSQILERGFVYGNNPDPTTDDIKLVSYPPATGRYEASASYLSADSVYYVRSFATNELGTAYGHNAQFNTPL